MTAATALRSAPRRSAQRPQAQRPQAQRPQAQHPQAPRPAWTPQVAPILAVEMAAQLSRQQEQRELICSVIGLAVKLGLSVVAAVSLLKLASAYQQRMERQGELQAVLNLQTTRVQKVRNSFDDLFGIGGEQRLLRKQDQLIAPNRLRVVWQNPQGAEEPTADPSSATQTLAAVNP